MPMGDRTGPMGQGPRTGRAAGFCAGFGAPGYLNRGPGFGFGFGRGGGRGRGGRGWRNWFYATGLTGWQRAAAGWAGWGQPAPYPQPTAASELERLQHQADFLQQTLDSIRQQITQLTAKEAPAQAEKPGNAA